jgi:hypothetical protein
MQFSFFKSDLKSPSLATFLFSRHGHAFPFSSLLASAVRESFFESTFTFSSLHFLVLHFRTGSRSLKHRLFVPLLKAEEECGFA